MTIKPSAAIRQNYNEIAELCRRTAEPVFLTKNGEGAICQTFREKAAKYGFILRYPAGKEHITGIGHEPWHFRYVGVPHAEIMASEGLTLVEYTDFLTGFP